MGSPGCAGVRPGGRPRRPWCRLLRIGRYPYAVIRDLADGHINMRATALVFTTMLSIVPLLAFTFIIIRQFGNPCGRGSCSPS